MDTIFFRGIPVLLLLACVIAVPAAAAPADNSTADHHIAIRQAHLAWSALKTDYEMDAALTYVGTRYETDTRKMASLLADFRNAESRISQTSTDAGLDTIISDLRKATRGFQDETAAQMSAGTGSWSELTGKVSQATSNNPYIEDRKNQYWNLRRDGQLADFDAWAAGAQAELNSLSARGYDITKAQRALDVTIAKRPDLKAALESRDEDRITAAYAPILSLSSDYVVRASEIGQQVPDDSRLNFLLDQASRAVGKADRLNPDILVITLDLGSVDPALSRLKNDIVTTRRMVSSGKLESANKNLPVLKKDLTDLAEGYREIARAANLPPELSGALNAMAVNLDNTAGLMGGS